MSLSSVKRCVNKAARGESLAPKKSPGSTPKIGEKAGKLLADDLEERPFVTLQERHDYIEAMTELSLGRATVCRAIIARRIGSTRKKGGELPQSVTSSRGRPGRVMVAAAVGPERLVFVDECGVHPSLCAIYGYAPRGERPGIPVPRNRGKNTTLLSSMTTEGMGPSLAVEGATTARVFEVLRREGARPEPLAGADRGDGQPGCP